MVSLNVFDLKKHLINKMRSLHHNRDIQDAFFEYTNLIKQTDTTVEDNTPIGFSVLGFNGVECKTNIEQVLGMSHKSYGTPMPWALDIWTIFGLKIAAISSKDHVLNEKFTFWVTPIIDELLKAGRLDNIETTIALFIKDCLDLNNSPSDTGILFLSMKKLIPEVDIKNHFDKFIAEFSDLESCESSLSITTAIYVFNNLSKNLSTLPSNYWSLNDLSTYLQNLSIGLNSWTWEDKSMTRGGDAVKWYINNEYHVQNLLNVLLAPIFPDIKKEFNTGQIGQKNPRTDLYIPQLDTMIEVKFRKGTRKTFQNLIDELAADKTLYNTNPKYSDSKLIAFLWDGIASTEEHGRFKQGVLEMGFDACIIISAPSLMV